MLSLSKHKVEPLKKFLIVNPFGIGDVLFTTPIIRAIKDSQPDSIIGYWCNERVEDVFKDNPSVDKIFALSRGDLKRIYLKSRWQGIYSFLDLSYKIRRERFDILLDFSLDHRYSLLAKFLGIKKRIGFHYKNRGRFLTDRIDIDSYSHKHVIEYYLDLLKFIDIKPQAQDARLELFIPEGDTKRINDLLYSMGISSKDLIIGMAPGAGASWGVDASLKHWSAIKFAQLADRIINDLGVKILILGDASEEHIAHTLINTMVNNPIDLVGKTTLRELIAFIDSLHILITNDGGPLHIAAALNKKTVSFFGPVDPKVYGPYPPDKNRHIVLRKALDCSPCYSKFRLSSCQRNKECLDTIVVEEAFKAVKRLLG